MTPPTRLTNDSDASGWTEARFTATAIARSGAEREALAAAVDYFERLLGTDWPGWDERRPLARTFFSGTDAATVSGVELHRFLLLVSDDQNLAEVVGQLQSPSWEQFIGAEMVLDLASRARLAGFDTRILRARGAPIADLQIRVFDRWVTVECVALHQSASMRDGEAVFSEVARWLHESGIDAVGRTTITLEDLPSPAEVLRRLPELKAIVHGMATDGRDRELLPGFAQIRFERGLRALPVAIEGLGGEPVDTDIRRLRGRIREKSRQLDVQGPTVLVARTRHLFVFDVIRSEMVEALAAALDEELRERANISAILVYETWVATPPPARSWRSARSTVVEGPDGVGAVRMALLAQGMSARAPLTDEEVALLVGAAPNA